MLPLREEAMAAEASFRITQEMLMACVMDLIQVGVSVTCSWKKNPLCQSQGGAGPARRAKWSLHFVHNLYLV